MKDLTNTLLNDNDQNSIKNYILTVVKIAVGDIKRQEGRDHFITDHDIKQQLEKQLLEPVSVVAFSECSTALENLNIFEDLYVDSISEDSTIEQHQQNIKIATGIDVIRFLLKKKQAMYTDDFSKIMSEISTAFLTKSNDASSLETTLEKIYNAANSGGFNNDLLQEKLFFIFSELLNQCDKDMLKQLSELTVQLNKKLDEQFNKQREAIDEVNQSDNPKLVQEIEEVADAEKLRIANIQLVSFQLESRLKEKIIQEQYKPLHKRLDGSQANINRARQERDERNKNAIAEQRRPKLQKICAQYEQHLRSELKKYKYVERTIDSITKPGINIYLQKSSMKLASPSDEITHVNAFRKLQIVREMLAALNAEGQTASEQVKGLQETFVKEQDFLASHRDQGTKSFVRAIMNIFSLGITKLFGIDSPEGKKVASRVGDALTRKVRVAKTHREPGKENVDPENSKRPRTSGPTPAA